MCSFKATCPYSLTCFYCRSKKVVRWKGLQKVRPALKLPWRSYRITTQRPNSPAHWLREQHLNGESSASQQGWFHSWWMYGCTMRSASTPKWRYKIWQSHTICISAQVIWNIFQLMNLWRTYGLMAALDLKKHRPFCQKILWKSKTSLFTVSSACRRCWRLAIELDMAYGIRKKRSSKCYFSFKGKWHPQNHGNVANMGRCLGSFGEQWTQWFDRNIYGMAWGRQVDPKRTLGKNGVCKNYLRRWLQPWHLCKTGENLIGLRTICIISSKNDESSQDETLVKTPGNQGNEM